MGSGLFIFDAFTGNFVITRQVVKPKLEALRIAEVKLEDAQKELEAAESKLQGCQVQRADKRRYDRVPTFGVWLNVV